jgi:hypothetical protein
MNKKTIFAAIFGLAVATASAQAQVSVSVGGPGGGVQIGQPFVLSTSPSYYYSPGVYYDSSYSGYYTPGYSYDYSYYPSGGYNYGYSSPNYSYYYSRPAWSGSYFYDSRRGFYPSRGYYGASVLVESQCETPLFAN